MRRMMPLRVAVIGAGRMGAIHARILADLAGVEPAAVCDPDPRRREAVARKTGAEPLSDHHRLGNLAGRVDAAVVAAPTAEHAAITLDLLAAGIHVLVEKPIARSLDEAEAMVAAARRAKRVLAVGHVERFHPAVRAALPFVEAPRFIEAHRLSPFPERSLDVGVVLDLMIHDLDVLLSLVGDSSAPVRIDAVGAPVLSEKEDIANARIAFAGGCVANLTASRVSTQTMRKFRVFGPDRYVSIDTWKGDLAVFRRRPGVARVESMNDIERIAPRVEKAEPLRLELEAFAAACRDGRPPDVPGEAGRDALALALEVLRRIQGPAPTAR
jgi:predicted dehydrogenase